MPHVGGELAVIATLSRMASTCCPVRARSVRCQSISPGSSIRIGKKSETFSQIRAGIFQNPNDTGKNRRSVFFGADQCVGTARRAALGARLRRRNGSWIQ